MDRKHVLDHPVMRWVEFFAGTVFSVVVWLMENPSFLSPLTWKALRFCCFAATVFMLAYHILPGLKNPSEREIARKRELSDRLNKLLSLTATMTSVNNWNATDIDSFLMGQQDYPIVRGRMRKLDMRKIELWAPIGGENIHPRILELEKAVREYKEDFGLPD